MPESGWTVAGLNVARKAWRRVLAVPPRIRQRLKRRERDREIRRTHQVERDLERELGRIVRGSSPILAGPWLSEVGYEVLYWVPFLRWVARRYDVPRERLVVVSRGGAAAWYADFAGGAVEVFDLIDPATFATRNAERAAAGTGTLKQFETSELDRELLDAAAARLGLPRSQVLHPSLLYRLFHQFWLGHRSQGFYDDRTRAALITTPEVALPEGLPSHYVAAKFYTAASLPASPEVIKALGALLTTLAARTPVVLLETGTTFDDHGEHTFAGIPGVTSLRGRLTPRDNLAVQTAVIAGARAFVGTCGSLAWLAPMLGIDTTAVMADPRFLHHHLQVARRVYQRLDGAGRFSVLDIGAFEQLGLSPELRLAAEPSSR